MTTTEQQTDTPPTAGTGAAIGPSEELSKDTLFQLLGNRRRRWVIRYLIHEEQVPLGDLAAQLAAWEHETTSVTASQRKSTYTALQQHHLPTLDEAGVIDFAEETGTVAATDRLQDLDVYLEVVSESNIPWSVYYLGVGMVSCSLVGLATVIDGGLFAVIPDIGWAALIACVVTVSGGVHTYHARSMRVDNGPPEVDLEP